MTTAKTQAAGRPKALAAFTATVVTLSTSSEAMAAASAALARVPPDGGATRTKALSPLAVTGATKRLVGVTKRTCPCMTTAATTIGPAPTPASTAKRSATSRGSVPTTRDADISDSGETMAVRTDATQREATKLGEPRACKTTATTITAEPAGGEISSSIKTGAGEARWEAQAGTTSRQKGVRTGAAGATERP